MFQYGRFKTLIVVLESENMLTHFHSHTICGSSISNNVLMHAISFLRFHDYMLWLGLSSEIPYIKGFFLILFVSWNIAILNLALC